MRRFRRRISGSRGRTRIPPDVRQPVLDQESAVGRCDRLYVDRPSLEVDGGFVVNANIAYAFDMGARVKLGGRNIFEKTFPAVYGQAGYGYDPTRYDARGRSSIWSCRTRGVATGLAPLANVPSRDSGQRRSDGEANGRQES